MKYLSMEEFIERYHPLVNAYFPNSPYDGYLYDPSLLAQISGFIQTRQIWTVFREEIPELTAGGFITKYFAVNDCSSHEYLVGYFVTQEDYRGTGERIVVTLPPPF